jgi:tRNA pseudouridine32 synthase/23S rRNA pseudouridine746 synthase
VQVPPLSIHHATAHYAVIEKPSGLLSVPGKGPHKQDCAASRVRAMFPNATGPLVVHRLDMETSGLLVFGLTADAQRSLSGQFERRIPEKRYIALVEGVLPQDEGRIDLPMRPDVANRPWQMIDHIHGRGASTLYRVMAREIDRTRVRFEPITGRAHQLRLHAATMSVQGGLGAPILGDVLYGRMESAPRLMLHAAYLSFLDPASGARVEFESPTPF